MADMSTADINERIRQKQKAKQDVAFTAPSLLSYKFSVAAGAST